VGRSDRRMGKIALRYFMVLKGEVVPGGRDIAVGIATRYGLHGPGFELRRGYRVFSLRVKRPGHVVSTIFKTP